MQSPLFLLSARPHQFFFERGPKRLKHFCVSVYTQLYSAHAQRADLEILNFGQVRLPTITVHSIIRNLLTVQFYQVFAHEPKRDTRHCKLKSRLRCHPVSSAANRREDIDDILCFDPGPQLLGQVGRVAPVDKHMHMTTQVAVLVE